MKFHRTDGGRAAAGYAPGGDCVVRAIAIAAQLPYATVYQQLRDRDGVDPDRGVHKRVYHRYIAELGGVWLATMQVGQGCRVHLSSDELPPGRLIVRLSRHLAAVIDGTLHDLDDCTRDGTRCVYGYWVLPR